MPSANPYVGPRPFETGQQLFGRAQQVAELRYLLTSERIVLLYSPSGAGKSSLVNAGLIPEMSARFDLWGPTRVNAHAPEGTRNRYAWSAIAGIEKSESHPDITLAEYAASRPRDRNPLILFDQFEEILRVDPVNVEEKEAFFHQLGELLTDRSIWALFILREDYLAPLDPFVRALPTHLQKRYRIDRLTHEMAVDAIALPAQGTGRSYAPGVVAKLARDLATERSRYIEPLQLQVVCFDLWDRMEKAGKAVIEEDDLGDVSGALRNYYDNGARNAAPDERAEREIRDWFENQLIAPDGIRNQVRGDGLASQYIASLLDSYLVRVEPRGDTPWYELAHDRLVEPVRSSNAVWFEDHLSKVQKVAKAWARQDRPPGLLLLNEDLAQAEQWASEQKSLTPVEQRFLEESRNAQRVVDEKAEQERKLREALRRSRSQRLGMAALLRKDENFSLACLLSVEAFRTMDTYEARHALLTVAQGSRFLTETTFFSAPMAGSAAMVFSENGRVLVVRNHHEISLWDVEMVQRLGFVERAPLDAPAFPHAQDCALSPDGEVLAFSNAFGSRLFLTRLESLEQMQELVLPNADENVTAIAFYPSGKQLAAGTNKGSVWFWESLEPEIPGFTLHGDSGAITGLAFSPNGTVLATASFNAHAALWDLESRQQRFPPIPLGENSLYWAVRCSPGGTLVAAGAEDSSVIRVFDARSGEDVRVVYPKTNPSCFGFTPNGNWLAIGRLDGEIELVRIGEGDLHLTSPKLDGHAKRTRALWSDLSGKMVSASDDGSLRKWDLDVVSPLSGASGPTPNFVSNLAFNPVSGVLAMAGSDESGGAVWFIDPATGLRQREPLRTNGETTHGVAFSSDGKLMATGGLDAVSGLEGGWKLWDAASGMEVGSSAQRMEYVNKIAFNPDGARIATMQTSHGLQLWRAATGEPLGEALATKNTRAYSGTVRGEVAFSPDGRKVAAAEPLTVFDVETGAEVIGRMTSPLHGFAEYLAFSPDGKVLASINKEGEVRLWDPTTMEYGELLGAFWLEPAGIAWGHDGKTLIAGAGGEFRIWDVSTGQPLGEPFHGERDFDDFTKLALSPGGAYLALTTLVSKRVHFWRLSPEFLISLARKRSGRNLSLREWKQYMDEGALYRKTWDDLPGTEGIL